MRPMARLSMIMVTLTALSALTACGSKPIVGVLLPISGAASTYGESMKEGIDMAVEQARAEGSLPAGFMAVEADSQSDPATAAAELERLASEGAKIVVAGTTSGEAKALLPVMEKTDTLVLSPSASLPSLTRDSKLFFRVFSSDELEGRRAARFLREEQGRESVLIFSQDSEQARGIEPPFRQVFEQAMGGKVVGRVVLSNPEWERETADFLAAHGPESVYVIAYADRSIDVLRFLRDRGYKGTICLTSAFYSGEVVEQHSELVDGVFFPQPAFDTEDENPLVQQFVSGFRERYGHDPDIYAAHAYDAMRVVFRVIEEASVYETSELRRALQFGVKEFPGVTGIIQFNDYGDVHHNPIMFIIKDGQVRNYERYVEQEKEKIRDRIRNLLGR